MIKFRLPARANRDLEDILETGLRDSGSHATRNHLAGFDRIFRLLRGQSRAGQIRADLGRDMRAFSLHPHRIVYRAEADRFLIVRIVHAARDAPGILKRSR